MLIEALVAVALVAAPSSDQARAERSVLRAADVPGATAAPPTKSLSPCAVPGRNPTGVAYGPVLFFGRAEIVSAARVYRTAAEARGAAAATLKRLASPCLARTLRAAYEAQGVTFAPAGSTVARESAHASRVRLHFLLRDRHEHTGEGVYDVVLVRRGRTIAGIAVVNPIDDAWERRLVGKVESRLG